MFKGGSNGNMYLHDTSVNCYTGLNGGEKKLEKIQDES